MSENIFIMGYNKKILIYLLYCWTIIFFIFSSGKLFTVDSFAAAMTARSMIYGHLDTNPNLLTIKADNGKHYYRHELFWSAVLVPFEFLSIIIEKTISDDMKSLIFPQGVNGVILPFANHILTSLILILLFIWLRELGVGGTIAFWIMIAGGLSTFLLPYARDLFRQPLDALLLMLAIRELWKLKDGREKVLSFWAGFYLCLAISNRCVTIAFLPVFFIGYFIKILKLNSRKKWWEVFPFFLIPIITGIFIYFFTVYLRWGNPFFNPGYKENFPSNLIQSVPSFFLSPERGFITYFPLWIFIFWGFPALWKKGEKWLSLMIIWLSVFFFLIYGKYVHYYGGVNPGPRYFLPLVALWLIPIGILFKDEWKKMPFKISFIILAVFGAVVNIYECLTNYTIARSAGNMISKFIMPSIDDGLRPWNIGDIQNAYWIGMILDGRVRIVALLFLFILISSVILLLYKTYKVLKFEEN